MNAQLHFKNNGTLIYIFVTYIDNIALSPYKFAQMYSFQRDIISEAFSDLRDHGYGKSHSKKRWRALKMDILNICDEQAEAERRFKRTLSDINDENTEKEGDLQTYQQWMMRTNVMEYFFNIRIPRIRIKALDLSIENLRPICQNCNSSMNTKNMNDYINEYKIH